MALETPMVTENMIEAAKAEAKALADRAGIDIGDDHDMFVDDLAQTLTRFAALSTDAEPVKPKRWLIEETLPSGSVRWFVVEHEHQARVEADKFNAKVTPLYAALSAADQREKDARREGWQFVEGDIVRKKSGSWWEGRVVGTYSTEQTPRGYAVQLDKPNGPVQIYPESALVALQSEER